MKHDEALLGTREGCTMMALRAFLRLLRLLRLMRGHRLAARHYASHLDCYFYMPCSIKRLDHDISAFLFRSCGSAFSS